MVARVTSSPRCLIYAHMVWICRQASAEASNTTKHESPYRFKARKLEKVDRLCLLLALWTLLAHQETIEPTFITFIFRYLNCQKRSMKCRYACLRRYIMLKWWSMISNNSISHHWSIMQMTLEPESQNHSTHQSNKVR